MSENIRKVVRTLVGSRSRGSKNKICKLDISRIICLPKETGDENSHGINASLTSPKTQVFRSENPVDRDIDTKNQVICLDED